MSRFLSFFFLFFAITYRVGNCGNKKKIKKLENAVDKLKGDLKIYKQLLDEHMGGSFRERLNVATLNNSTLKKLNDALRAMKENNDPNDWRSFKNVANYHGIPPMCTRPDWNVSYPGGNGDFGCCVHHTEGLPYFVAWHRLFLVNFEEYLGRAYGDDTISI